MKKILLKLVRFALCGSALIYVAASVTLDDQVALLDGQTVIGQVVDQTDESIILAVDGGTRDLPLATVARSPNGRLAVQFGLRTTWRSARKNLGLIALAIFALVPLLQGYRITRLANREQIPVTLVDGLRISLAGNFLNFAAPLGSTAGDVFKAYFLAQHTRRKAEAMTLVFVDRALGLATLLATVGVVALLSSDAGRLAPLRVYVAAMLGAGALGAGLYLSPWIRSRAAVQHYAALLPKADLLHRIDAVIVRLWHRKGTLARVIGATVILQVICAVSFAVLCRALGMHADLGNAAEYYAFFSAGELVKALPGPPQGFGTAEMAYTYLFQAFGSSAQIICAAVGMRLVMLVCAMPGAILVAIDGGVTGKVRSMPNPAWAAGSLGVEPVA